MRIRSAADAYEALTNKEILDGASPEPTTRMRGSQEKLFTRTY